MRSMQWQLGIWEPSQHLLEDRGKTVGTEARINII
jgi:hypothetical protein